MLLNTPCYRSCQGKISMKPSTRASVALALPGKVSSVAGLRRLYSPSEQLGKGESEKDDCG
jgi:hypothetical protein